MTTPQALMIEAAKHGLTLEPRGEYIAVTPEARLTPDFESELKEHKPELLRYWSDGNLIKQIFAGEYSGCESRDMVQAITSTLQSSRHPLALPALSYLYAAEEK